MTCCQLVLSDTSLAHQCARIEGGPTHSTYIPATPPRLPCATEDGQHGCSSLHQQPRPLQACAQAVDVGVSTPSIPQSSTGARRQTACPEEAQARENGGSTRRSWQRSSVVLGQQLQMFASLDPLLSVLLPGEGQPSPRYRHHVPSVAPGPPVCVSPIWFP